MPKTKINSIKHSSEEHSSLSSCTSSSLSSDEEEIDARDLKPIKDHLSNRKELARQLFRSVKPEKIRMMLPQVLKHMDLSELEEWCVSELSGMSKARILSILNGKPMLESSDTSESDDSGPSLEIISDTEEWLTDDDTSKKENGAKGKLRRDKAKVKGKPQNNKKNDLDKSNVKAKKNIKNENSDKTNDVKVKKEDDKDKEKEGDSLLDLLELEMRARAIRALIRKEEDVIPPNNPPQTNSRTIENNIGMPQDDAKAKKNCRKQLERIINAQQGNKGEDEDVVLVVQPTPVVELLSSDSDEEACGGARINQKFENERAAKTGKSTGNSNENAKNSSKTNSQNSKEGKGTQEITGTHNNTNIVIKTDLNTRSEARTIMPERNIDIKNNMLSISISADNIAERRKKSKKRSHTKSQLTSTSKNSPKLKQSNTIEIIEQLSDTNNEITDELSDKNMKKQSRTNISEENKVIAEEENKVKEKVAKENKVEEEESVDLDEIFDLDDYCDVMDIENCDEDKSQDSIIVSPQQEIRQPECQAIQPKLDSTETWVSRYYQTDDVQNVIKESKIQSEIRKRLRERQRLSKLSKSPNLNLSPQSSANDATATLKKTPTGSVEEYLALKRAINANNISNSNNNNNNTTMQDDPATDNFNIDINAKEVEDKNVSSCQSTDNDVQKASISEAITAKPVKVVINIKDNT